jgi:hypothetical protein
VSVLFGDPVAVLVLLIFLLKTLRGVEGAWVKDMNVSIEDGNIKGYRVNLEVTFQLEDPS